jgi:carboxylesterase
MSYAGLIPTAEPFFFPGEGAGCLLVHGFTGAPKEMRKLGTYLAGQGHAVLGVRLAAHATQPQDMIRARWHDWLASVEDGYHLLSGCCDQIFVLGLSMGGLLALTLAARLPVAGLVIMATPHHLPNDPRIPFLKPLSLLQPFIPKGPSNYFEPQAFAEHVCYPADPTRAYVEVRILLSEMRAALPKISAPALLIYSRQDAVVTPQERHMELIYESLGSADKSSLWIENSSHVITCDAQRQQVFEAAGQFIARFHQTAA